MVNIISRAGWGARTPRSRSVTSWANRTEFVVHYSAGPSTQTVRAIQDHHMDTNGWSDIGYNFLVDTAGNVYEGRGWTVIGAHATGHNTSGIGVCFIGYDGDATTAAKASIRALYDEANQRAGRTLARKGHRDVNPTSCPGDDLHSWVLQGMSAVPGDGGGGSGPYEPYRTGVVPGSRTIRLYSAGDDVKVAQAAFGADDDGWYGPATATACRTYQSVHGLDVDGVTGPLTWAEIVGTGSGSGTASDRAASADRAPAWPQRYLRDFTRHSAARIWQARMRDRGWSIAVDGAYGSGSARVCAQFQREKRLTVDGVVGPVTWRAAWEEPVT